MARTSAGRRVGVAVVGQDVDRGGRRPRQDRRMVVGRDRAVVAPGHRDRHRGDVGPAMAVGDRVGERVERRLARRKAVEARRSGRRRPCRPTAPRCRPSPPCRAPRPSARRSCRDRCRWPEARRRDRQRLVLGQARDPPIGSPSRSRPQLWQSRSRCPEAWPLLLKCPEPSFSQRRFAPPGSPRPRQGRRRRRRRPARRHGCCRCPAPGRCR